MARFELKSANVEECGETVERVIVVDRSTFETVEAPFGSVVMARGFVRCKGQQYVGQYGSHTPIYNGSEDDIYYSPMFFFDGEWSHSGPSSRGIYSYVKSDSGTGKLFSELESVASGVEAI